MHLVGFIIGIYHDARSPERQTVPNNEQDSYLQLPFYTAVSVLGADPPISIHILCFLYFN